MSRTVILEPTGRAGAITRTAWRPLPTLRGKVIGFIDNSKPNFHLLADDLAELLVSRYGAAGVVRHRKLSASIPAPESVMEEVTTQCDLVITGSGD
jgi:hypothetical protein